MVTSEKVGGKRIYSLTDSGRELVDTLPTEALWDVLAQSDPGRRLREVFHALMVVTSQVGRTGSPVQIEKTTEILSEARKRIYGQLAEGE
jgi:DNA-binding PadR family transcriptional regulator